MRLIAPPVLARVLVAFAAVMGWLVVGDWAHATMTWGAALAGSLLGATFGLMLAPSVVSLVASLRSPSSDEFVLRSFATGWIRLPCAAVSWFVVPWAAALATSRIPVGSLLLVMGMPLVVGAAAGILEIGSYTRIRLAGDRLELDGRSFPRSDVDLTREGPRLSIEVKTRPRSLHVTVRSIALGAREVDAAHRALRAWRWRR